MASLSIGVRTLAVAAIASTSFAQTSFPEVEPNSAKSEATAVVGIVAGDSITGTSTGTVTTAGDTTSASVDMYRVQTAAAPLAIYKHTLSLTSTTGGNAMTVRGVTQVAGAPTATEVELQAASNQTNSWYGFGKQEELYYRVSGGAGSTGAYSATLTTAPVVPIAIPGLYNPGQIVITTAGQGHSTDTEIYLYDSNLDPVPLGHNDDNTTAGGLQSRVVVTLNSGTYYVGVSIFNTANNIGDANPLENYLTGPLLDFPNVLVNNSTSTTSNVGFSISDGGTTTPVAATHSSVFDIAWGQFTVQVNTNPPANDACAAAQSVGSGTFGGILTYATNDGAASCDPGGATSRDVWYSFTDPTASGGTLSVDTCSTVGDTVVSVYNACGGTEIACNDDCGGAPCGGTTSCATAILTPGQTVKIRVSDKGTGSVGLYTLHTSFVGNPPINDLCANALALPGPGTFPFDTTLATPGETVGTCSSVPGKNLWYSYAATTNGTGTVTTCGTTTGDTEIWIYSGAGCPIVPAIACNDDACGLQTTVNFPTTCGTVYMIEVANFSTSLTININGTFTVSEVGTGCSTPSTPECPGDTAALCPCSGAGGSGIPNPGAAGNGCANSAFPAGAILTSSGIAVDNPSDTLVLTCSNMPGPGLFFQANGLIGPILNFNDGTLCAASGIIRMGVVFPAAGVASYPGGLTPNPIHIAGAPVMSPTPTKHYQCWYRDITPGFCNTLGHNMSNGLAITWSP
jgi:hypothetical protein